MANLVITSKTNTLIVDFGIYSEDANVLGFREFKRSLLSGSYIDYNNESITVEMTQGRDWWVQVSGYTGSQAMVVDSIDGATFSTLSDLRDGINGLII